MATETAPTPESTPAAAAAPETPEAGAATGATEATATTQPTQPTPAAAPEMLTVMGMQIEKAKVHPELLSRVEEWNKSYTQKSQAASDYEKKAKALDRLTAHEGFRKWYAEQLNPQPRQPAEDRFALSAEKQAELLSDPTKMRQYIEELTLSKINEVVVPTVRQAQYETKVLKSQQEAQLLASKYGDFDELNNTGKIEAQLEKYAQRGVDLDLEDAYKLAKSEYAEKEAALRAHQTIQGKVNGTTLPPGGNAPVGAKVVAAKGLSFEEKMRMAATAALRGEKITFDNNK